MSSLFNRYFRPFRFDDDKDGVVSSVQVGQIMRSIGTFIIEQVLSQYLGCIVQKMLIVIYAVLCFNFTGVYLGLAS